ncbi:unnamed protein product [Moneuplotes crassus]|uniref:Uncharacterized protein n=1 Tax=Euplotes crassus TaxID=5936 RepID=A0AAD1UB22_EUPCR|nr:unnamed protein product [Moneuplotes crassus]
MVSDRPANIIIEHIQADLAKLHTFYSSERMECNYPEANLEATIHFNNFSFVNSDINNGRAPKDILRLNEVGNITVQNIDCRNYFSYLSDYNGCIAFLLRPTCTPTSPEFQNLNFENVTNNYIHPSNLFSVGNIVNLEQPHYRTISITFKGYKAEDLKIDTPKPLVSLIGYPTDSFLFSDIELKNTSNTKYLLSAYYFLGINVTGATISDTSDGKGIIYFDNCMTTRFNSFVVSNYILKSEVSLPFIFLVPMEQSMYGVYDTLVENCTFYNSHFIESKGQGAVIAFGHAVLKNVSLDRNKAFLKVSSAVFVEIMNATIIDCLPIYSDSSIYFFKEDTIIIGETDSDIMYFTYVQEINIINSPISLFKVDSVTGSEGEYCLYYLAISTISYSNCTINHPDPLISTEGIISLGSLNVLISFEHLSFVDVEHKHGDLIRFAHQVPQPVNFFNVTFERITNGHITLESSNLHFAHFKTSVQMINTMMDQDIVSSSSFFRAKRNSQLILFNLTCSNFQSLYSDGGFISAESDSIVQVHFSNLRNNSGIYSTLFSVKDKANMLLSQCNMINNFALTNGVLVVKTYGILNIHASVISQNYALENSVGEVLSYNQALSLSIVNISENQAISQSVLQGELIGCRNLCFIGSQVLDYIKSVNLSSLSYSDVAIQLLFSQIIIQNTCRISMQPNFINAFASDVSILNSFISDVDLQSTNIAIVTSNLVLRGVKINNITNPDNVNFILIATQSTLRATNINFQDSQSSLFSIQSSTIELLSAIKFTSVVNARSLIEVLQAESFVASDITILDSNATNQLLLFDRSSQISLESIQISNLQRPLISASKSNFILIQDIVISNSSKSVEMTECVVENMQQCEYSNNGSNSTSEGGALNLLNTDITINDSLFANNQAIKGAAISFKCTSKANCNLDFKNSTLTSNSATEKGGAIYYDYLPPNTSEAIFVNNSAAYGPNLASYPYRIGLVGSENSSGVVIRNIGSSMPLDENLELGLFDYDNQIMNLDSSTQFLITSSNIDKGTIRGTNLEIINKGIAIFDDLRLISTPGSSFVKYKVSSRTFETQKLLEVYNKSSTDTEILVDFRYCKPGEWQVGDKCEVCDAGTYSLQWNSTSCTQCVENAVCFGGSQVNVEPGYWRRLGNSTTIVECPYGKACKGGLIEESGSSTQCKQGYEGPMCSQCSVLDQAKYERQGEFQCVKCPEPISNAFRVAGLIILVFSYFMYLIIKNLKAKENDISILLRILTNYLQLITTSMSMSLSYPSFLNSVTLPFKRLGGSSDTFLSFDCFVTNYEIKGPFESNAVLKLFLLLVLPIILFTLIALIWILVWSVKKKWVKDIKKNLLISAISVIFLLHPRLTQASINTWRCIKADEGVNLARFDMSIECNSIKHLKYCVLFAVPICIIWVISMPLLGFILLYKNRKGTKDNKVGRKTQISYLHILYQGLTPECFYWEFINTIRKTLVLACLLLSQYVRIFFGVSILFVSGRIQIQLKPYKNEDHNKVEFLAINAGVITILSGLVFSEQDSVESMDTLTLALVLGANILFLTYWTYLLLTGYEEKYKAARIISRLLSCILCIKREKKEHSEENTVNGNEEKEQKEDGLARQKSNEQKKKRIYKRVYKNKKVKKIKNKRIHDSNPRYFNHLRHSLSNIHQNPTENITQARLAQIPTSKNNIFPFSSEISHSPSSHPPFGQPSRAKRVDFDFYHEESKDQIDHPPDEMLA